MYEELEAIEIKVDRETIPGVDPREFAAALQAAVSEAFGVPVSVTISDASDIAINGGGAPTWAEEMDESEVGRIRQHVWRLEALVYADMGEVA